MAVVAHETGSAATMATRPSRRALLRLARVLAVWLILVTVSTWKNNHQYGASTMAHNATHPRTLAEDADHFALCGRRLSTAHMPHVPTDAHVQYGVTRWRRLLDNAIILDNRCCHGRTGNQIRAFFHAYDWARDRGSALVVHGDGFPIEATLSKLYLGLHREDLVGRLGLIMYDTLDERQRSALDAAVDCVSPQAVSTKPCRLGTRWARDYVSTSPDYTTFDSIQHRHYILQQLFRMNAKEMELHPDSPGVKDMCASYHAFFGRDGQGASRESLKSIGIEKSITKKFSVIHSRSFEGKEFLEEAHRHYGVDPRASLDYPPDLIRAMLTPLGMTSSSILMITDGQNSEVANRLTNDATIGPHFQVVPDKVSTMSGDIMLGILSDAFIGNPASSFSQYIAMVRYALGLGPSYLHVRRGTKDEWEMFCDDESCFYKLHDLEAATHQPDAPKTIT